MSIHFMHVRKFNKETGEVDVKGGTTYAFDIDETDGNVVICYAEARCNDLKQNFCRKIGRQVSEGRYNKGKVNAAVFPAPADGKVLNAVRGFLAGL